MNDREETIMFSIDDHLQVILLSGSMDSSLLPLMPSF